MKINLRRAAKIAGDIQAEISRINIDSEKRIVSNQVADPVAIKNTEIGKFEASVERIISLTRILHSIRQDIGMANSVKMNSNTCSINQVLSDINAAKAQLLIFTKLLASENTTPEDLEWSSIYLANVDKRKSATYVDYGTENLTLSLMTPTFKVILKQSVISLKRSINKLSDALLFLNTNLEIDILSTDWETLEGEGIV